MLDAAADATPTRTPEAPIDTRDIAERHPQTTASGIRQTDHWCSERRYFASPAHGGGIPRIDGNDREVTVGVDTYHVTEGAAAVRERHG